jgi:hypothetical protein
MSEPSHSKVSPGCNVSVAIPSGKPDQVLPSAIAFTEQRPYRFLAPLEWIKALMLLDASEFGEESGLVGCQLFQVRVNFAHSVGEYVDVSIV